MIKKEKIKKFKMLVIMGMIAAVFLMGACNTNPSTESAVTCIDVSDMFSKKDMKNDYEESDCTIINLENENIEGAGAKVTSEGITITEEGEYILTGTYKNKKIKVEAEEDAKVRLILKDADIENEEGAAIYVKSADKVFITLSEGSANIISGVSEKISEDEETCAALFSKSDLTINGEGNLLINCTDGKGIESKDDLKIASGDINIKSSEHAISGKDSVRIAGGTIKIIAGADGINSSNDEDPQKGYVYIAGGSIEIDASDDGIHAETKMVIEDGNINIINSEEGIEGAIVEIAGGELNVISKDDGINASDGSTSSKPGGNKPGDSDSKQQGNDTSINLSEPVYILISNGEINIDAAGDGFDANGSVYVTGGNVRVSGPEDDGNGAFDYDLSAVITGGSFIACGSDGMAMNFTGAKQGCILLKLPGAHDSGEEITVKDENEDVILSYTPQSKFESILLSSKDINKGKTYTITVGDESMSVTMDALIYNDPGIKRRK